MNSLRWDSIANGAAGASACTRHHASLHMTNVWLDTAARTCIMAIPERWLMYAKHLGPGETSGWRKSKSSDDPRFLFAQYREAESGEGVGSRKFCGEGSSLVNLE